MNLGGLEPQWLWLVAAAILGIAELAAPGIFLIWVALAATLTGLVTALLGVTLPFQLLVFALFSMLSVQGGRHWYLKNPVPSSDPLLNDRAARLVGKSVTVIDAIRNGSGRVKVGDSVWNASGPDAAAGAFVRVVGAEGTCLRVEPEAAALSEARAREGPPAHRRP
jgi:membrane protein implicated in regulation of membrane protease activity